jgi:hypothetical protein
MVYPMGAGAMLGITPSPDTHNAQEDRAGDGELWDHELSHGGWGDARHRPPRHRRVNKIMLFIYLNNLNNFVLFII